MPGDTGHRGERKVRQSHHRKAYGRIQPRSLVVPGSIFSAESKGVHQFLKLGATPITSVEDLLQALGLAPREKREILRGDVSDEEMRVIDVLASPVSRDELIEALELPITEANILLSTMEIKGLIVEELGVVRVR